MDNVITCKCLCIGHRATLSSELLISQGRVLYCRDEPWTSVQLASVWLLLSVKICLTLTLQHTVQRSYLLLLQMFMPCRYGVYLQLIFNVLQSGSLTGQHQQHVGPLAKVKFDYSALLVRIIEVHVVASVCHERYFHSGLHINPEVLHSCLFGLESCSPVPCK